MAEKLPYVYSPGMLERALERMNQAATPPRFTRDFLNTKLSVKGGSANAIIPLLKKLGLIGTDGTPTQRYHRYRNPDYSRIALGEGIREAYANLYSVNEYAHDLDDNKLKNLIVEVTGRKKDDKVVQLTFSTFKVLRDRADFEATAPSSESDREDIAAVEPRMAENSRHGGGIGLNLGYTINLNLPATTDIKVFDAIFKSLREHLLRHE
ncbi:MAG: DUF5343 domain-containing protein [Acidobacteriota bacterium]